MADKKIDTKHKKKIMYIIDGKKYILTTVSAPINEAFWRRVERRMAELTAIQVYFRTDHSSCTQQYLIPFENAGGYHL